jgi:hypothetical protein
VVMHIVGSVALWIATLRLVLGALEPLPGERGVHAAEPQRRPGIASTPVATA